MGHRLPCLVLVIFRWIGINHIFCQGQITYVWTRTDYAKTEQASVVNLVCNTSSQYDIPSCEVLWVSPIRFRSNGPDTNFSQRQITQKQRQ